MLKDLKGVFGVPEGCNSEAFGTCLYDSHFEGENPWESECAITNGCAPAFFTDPALHEGPPQSYKDAEQKIRDADKAMCESIGGKVKETMAANEA